MTEYTLTFKYEKTECINAKNDIAAINKGKYLSKKKGDSLSGVYVDIYNENDEIQDSRVVYEI